MPNPSRPLCHRRVSPSAALLLFAAGALVLLAPPGHALAASGPRPGAMPVALELPLTLRGEAAVRMHELLTRAEAFGFGGQVLFAKKGEVLLHHAYGFADRAGRRPMTIDTRIGIASMSKRFTAAAILDLAEAGHVDLDGKLGGHLPDAPADKAGVTLRQLLTQSGGLSGADAGDDLEIADRADLLSRIFAQPVRAEPGAEWIYSNSGYSLLAAVVEEVTGLAYERYVHDELLTPAGLHATEFWHEAGAHLRAGGGVPWGLDAPVAHAYTAWKDQGSPATWPRNWRVFGTGDLLSTAAELYRWERALDAGRVLGRRTVAAMRSPQVRIDDSVSYGFALFIARSEEEGLMLEHGGDWIRGYNGNLFTLPEQEIVLVILSNSRDREGVSMRQAVQKELLEIARGVEPSAVPPASGPLSPAERIGLAGGYRLEDGSRLALFDDGVYLWIGAEGQGAIELLKSIPEEESAPLDATNGRTGRLLASLIREESGYAEALGEVGAPFVESYEHEWAGLLDERGALRSFRILGSHLKGSLVDSRARLTLDRGEVDMVYFWTERGRGRLGGSYVVPEWHMNGVPVALPVAKGPHGALIGYNPVREEKVRFRAESGPAGAFSRLVFEMADGTTRTAERMACDACPVLAAREIR